MRDEVLIAARGLLYASGLGSRYDRTSPAVSKDLRVMHMSLTLVEHAALILAWGVIESSAPFRTSSRHCSSEQVSQAASSDCQHWKVSLGLDGLCRVKSKLSIFQKCVSP